MPFDQNKYIQGYKKEHYKRFLVDLTVEEYEELEKLLKKNKLSKATFLRESIKNLKEKKDK